MPWPSSTEHIVRTPCPPECDCLDCTDLEVWCARNLGTLAAAADYARRERLAQRMLDAIGRSAVLDAQASAWLDD